MCFKFFGLFAIIPATMLLTISFFVIYAVLKTDKTALKSFGRVIVVLLWLCALAIFGAGICSTINGGPMHMMGKHMMHEKMQGMKGCQMMGGDKMDDEKASTKK